MAELTSDQISRAIELMKEWQAAPKTPDGPTPMQRQAESDRKRIQLIDGELKPLLDRYLAGQMELDKFKSSVDSLNKQNEYWGFKGPKGQMFFNMIVNAADAVECNEELKIALTEPDSDEIARSRIKTFSSFVRRVGDEVVEGGGSKQSRPKVGSVPFFLSYFWQIHNRHVWPVYYTNSVKVMTALNFWQPSEDQADNYIRFKRIHVELAAAFTKETGRPFDFYEVEHVFWFKGGNPFGGDKPLANDQIQIEPEDVMGVDTAVQPKLLQLPESYVPPVVAILPQMARNSPEMIDAAKASGLSIEKAFEKHVDIAFSILGFETTPLGQGKGRVPDGLARDPGHAYTIIWDAKVRADSYSCGTDDRTISEYIRTQGQELKKRGSMRKLYYCIISSSFSDDFDDQVSSLKMETDVNEVILIEADALVQMVDAKLRDPISFTLGSDGLQRLFTTSRIVTSDAVREMLIGR